MYGPEVPNGQLPLEMRPHALAICRVQGLKASLPLWDCDIVVLDPGQHEVDQSRIQEHRIAGRDVSDIPRGGAESVMDPRHRALIRHVVVDDRRRQRRQVLIGSGDDEDVGEDSGECANDVRNERLAVEREQRLRLSHPRAAPAREHHT